MKKRGIETLLAAVRSDCSKGKNCFNADGCNKTPSCSHRYCDKYVWIMDRAKHYAEKTGKTVADMVEIWETDRRYWYMNYYQDCNQPIIQGDSMMFYDDWIKELTERFGPDVRDWKFVCPNCGNIQSARDFIANNIPEPMDKVAFSCIGRYVGGVGCNWSLGGLFNIAKQTVIKNGIASPVFEMANKNEPATQEDPA